MYLLTSLPYTGVHTPHPLPLPMSSLTLQCGGGCVDHLQHLLESFARDAFEFDLALRTLLHTGSEHGPEVVGTRHQDHLVYLELLPWKNTPQIFQLSPSLTQASKFVFFFFSFHRFS